MRKYTGLTQPESDCHLKMSLIFHCLGLYNDPSDINFVRVHQNAIRNAHTLLPCSQACPGPPIRVSQQRFPGIDEWFLFVTHVKTFAYMESCILPPRFSRLSSLHKITLGNHGDTRIGGDLRIYPKPLINIH